MKIIVLTAPVILLSCIISVKGATLIVKGRPNEEINTDTDVEVVCIHPNISALLEALEYMKVDFEVIQGFIDSGSKGDELIFATKKGANCKGYNYNHWELLHIHLTNQLQAIQTKFLYWLGD